jgi:DNA-binding transcriptional ArsR family regulator
MVKESAMADTEGKLEPAQQLEIHDLEALKVMADPLRARIVDILRKAPATAKEMAALLEMSPKSLYYHLALLERHNLIRVVEARQVSGITEKRYRATAYLFNYCDLALSEGQSAGQGMQVMISSLFSITSGEIQESIREGRLLPDEPGVAPERTLQSIWNLLRLRPEEAAALGGRIQALAEEYASPDPSSDDETLTYRLLFMLFPTNRRRNNNLQ